MPISQSENHVKDLLESAGITVEYYDNELTQGYADFLCTFEGHAFWVEVKEVSLQDEQKFIDTCREIVEKKINSQLSGSHNWLCNYQPGWDKHAIEHCIAEMLSSLKQVQPDDPNRVSVIFPLQPRRSAGKKRFPEPHTFTCEMGDGNMLFMVYQTEQDQYCCPREPLLYGVPQREPNASFVKATRGMNHSEYQFILRYTRGSINECRANLDMPTVITTHNTIRNQIKTAATQIKASNNKKASDWPGIVWIVNSGSYMFENTYDRIVNGDTFWLVSPGVDTFEILRENKLKGRSAMSVLCIECDGSIRVHENEDATVNLPKSIKDIITSIKVK